MNLPRLAVERPVTTAMAIVAAVSLGGLALGRLPLQFLPEMSWPSATVAASYRGSSPEEVDRLVVRPLEEKLATLPHLKSISSTATQGSASVRLELEPDVDMDLMSLEIRERVELARPDLPADLDPVRVMRWSTSDFSVLHVSVSWAGARDELESVIEDRLVPALQRLPGVATVEVNGLTGKRVQVELDADRLEAHGLDAFQVAQAIRGGNANVSIAPVERDGRRFFLRAVGEVDSVQELAALPLPRAGLRLADVADVTLGFPDPARVERLDGHDAVTLEVYKATDGNLVDVARAARAALAELSADPGLAALRLHVIRDRSTEVVRSLGKLRDAGLWGGLLAAVALLFFLRQVRSTLIVLVSIPASILVTFALMLVLREAGLSTLTLNIVSLTGLMLAVGMLVDNSVVVMENIYRERRAGRDARQAALSGAGDVAKAVTAATLTTVVVFASLLGGSEETFGRWLAEFGLAMTIALIASLVVALTLVPMAASWLFRRPVGERRDDLPRIGAGYRRLLGTLLRFRWVALGAAAAMVWGSWLLLGQVDRRPAPRQPERRVTVDVRTDHGFTMPQYADLFARIEAALEPRRADLDIEAIVASYGTSRRNSWEGRAEIRLYLTDADAATRTTAGIRDEVRSLLPEQVGVSYRLERMQHWSGDQSVGVELSGRDPALLAVVATDVRERLASVAGLTEVETNLESGDEELLLTVDRTLAAERGVTPQAVARAVTSALGERPVSRYHASDREIDILLQLQGADRASLADLQRMEVESGDGQLVALSTIASIGRAPGPRVLRRVDRKQSITVSGEAGEGMFLGASRSVEAAMTAVRLPPGVSWEMGRGFRDWSRSQLSSASALLLALALIYLVMASLFESFVHPLTILASVPFALTGVAVLFWATSTPLDNMAWLGLLVLAGLVVNNGILLVDTANRLRRHHGVPRREAILEAGRLRLRPILITTITTLSGLFPLVAPALFPGLLGELEGRSRQWAPVSLAVFGGLLTSTILTLCVTPVVYSLVDDLGAFLSRTWRGSRPEAPAGAAEPAS